MQKLSIVTPCNNKKDNIRAIAIALLTAGLLALLLCLYQSCVISNGHITNMKIDS